MLVIVCIVSADMCAHVTSESHCMLRFEYSQYSCTTIRFILCIILRSRSCETSSPSVDVIRSRGRRSSGGKPQI